MSFANSFRATGRHRRAPKWQVRAIEYRRRSVSQPTTSGYARHVGRVGALAFALGVGSAIAAVPMAFADTTGSAGSTGSVASATSPSVSAASRKTPSRGPSRAVRGDKPSAGTSAAASARSAHSGVAGGAAAAASSAGSSNLIPATTSSKDGAVVNPGTVVPSTVASSPGSPALEVGYRALSGVAPVALTISDRHPTAAAAVNPFADFMRGLVGNGTAENPNAGILLGNGYSYTSYEGACLSGTCNGGNSGLIGDGGNGFAGGNGGAQGNAFL